MEFREISLNDKNKVLYILSQLTKTSFISNEKFNNFLENKSPNHHIYVMLVNNDIIGCGTILIEPKIIRNMSNVGHIEDIVIDVKERGNGYGIQLINFLVKIGKEHNCYKVILDCDIENKKFYEKCLFKQKGVCMSLYF